ncbi:hypothetical protein A2U01_0113845, partial [Trifolium medium]|nr:hypothetical protein [Trifolium medium]
MGKKTHQNTKAKQLPSPVSTPTIPIPLLEVVKIALYALAGTCQRRPLR